MTSRRRVLYAGIAAAVFTSAGVYPAYAYVCHPDPPGTRSLTVGGMVERYSMHGARVSIDYRAHGSCKRVSWNIRGGDARSKRIACGQAAPAVRTAAHVGARRVAIQSGAVDEPDRLVVRKSGRVVRSWPLPDRFRTLDAYGDLALLGTKSSRETYAVRLSDGRAALVALNHRGDSPQIEAPGIVYQDNVLKRHESAGRRVVKFVPMRAVERAVDRAGRPLTIAGEIADLAMDGARVAIAVHGLAPECDRVMFWNVPWQYVSRLTEEDELTCRQTQGSGRIGVVAVGGIGAEWTTAAGGTRRVLSATIVDCVERVIASARGRQTRLTSLSADGGLLAYAVAHRGGGVVGAVGPEMRPTTISRRSSAPLAVHVDAGRIAVLGADGRVELVSAAGDLLQTFAPTAPAAIALRGNRLVVLTRDGYLQVFDADSGAALASWRVPRGVNPTVDVHFGVAVVAKGSTVLGVDLNTGRVARLATAPGRVTAEIDAPGVVYGFSARGTGHVYFVPFARIEAALR
jgi:hypothetical protein